jgi:LysM repeat protein
MASTNRNTGVLFSMDTHSKTGSYLPVLGAILGGIGLIVGIIGAVQARAAKKEIAALRTDLEGRVSDAETAASTARGNADRALQVAQGAGQRIDQVVAQTRGAMEQVGTEFAAIRSDLTKITTAMAARPAPAPSQGGTSSGPTVAPGSIGPDGTYAVKSGDTLSGIARQFNVSVADIEKANPGVDSRRLAIGQKLKIPGVPAPRS